MNEKANINARPRWKLHLVAAIAAVSSLATPGTAPASNGVSNHTLFEKVWVDGVTHKGYVRYFGGAPQGPDVDVYLVGNIDLDHPQDNELEPGAPAIHDHVVSKTPYGHRGRCRVYVVFPGPNAADDTVHGRITETWPGYEWYHPPYEIDLGDGFVPLVSNEIVLAGVAAGLLELSPDLAEGADALCWTSGEDPSFPSFD
jgi:hypothetical protein